MASATGGEKVSQRSTVLHGPLRFIIRSAHKWGGNGVEPKEEKIKRVLSTKHPEVIAKVFQGNADKAASWIKDAWMRYHGKVNVGKTGAGPTYWRRGRKGGKLHAGQEVGMSDLLLEYAEVDSDFMDEAELFMDSTRKGVKKDGLIWVEATRTGKFLMNPVKGATGPLVIDDAMLDKTIANFDAGAWEHVTLPLADEDDDKVHRDLTRFNTGAVKALRKAKDPEDGRTVLLAGCDITDPKAEEMVLNGSIRGRSVGIRLTGVTDPETMRRFDGPVMRHLAWTNKPFVSKLKPGAVDPDDYVYASRLEEDVQEIEVMLTESDDPTDGALEALEGMVESEGLAEDDDNQRMDEIVASLELAAPEDETPAEETTDGTVPPKEHYRVSTSSGTDCAHCTHFDRASKNRHSGMGMGECKLWDAPVHGDHVCDAFKAASTKSPGSGMYASRDSEEPKVIRLRG